MSPAAARPSSGPVRLRTLLERRGPGFTKIGQFLALRPDLLPQEYCDELLSLVDQAPSFPWEQARAILTEDLGGPPESRFASVDPHPVAAASVAQVHLAVTHQGDEVAVKVQRPGIREQVRRDLKQARLLSRLLRSEGASVAVATNELLAELQRWMDEELDFGLELRNLEKLHQALEGERRVRIPRPYPALSGPRVVTSSYLRGVRFSDLLRWIRAGEGGRIEEQGLDREALARNLVDAVLDQIFQLDRFHADPHPGNLMALPGDAIGFVDFGRMDHLTEDLRRVVSRNLQAIYNADAERMHAALTDLLIPGQRVDSDAFRADFIGRSRAYSRERTEDRPPPGTRSPLASYLRDVMRLARRHGYRLPPDVLSLYRALLSVESVCQELGTQANLRTVGRRFFARYQVAQAVMDLTPDRLWQSALDGLALLREGPGHLQRVLSDLAQDRFLLRVRTTESTDDRREANRRARLVTAGLISVGLAVLLAAVDRIPLLGRWPPAATVLASLLGACYVWIFVLWKRLS